MADELGEQLVDALGRSYGVHPGHRAAHARGVLCAATFTPTEAAAGLSRAPHFAGGPFRAHVRFSNGSGNPDTPDATRDGRGLALKVYLPNGTTTDIIGLTIPVFFVRTPEELLLFNEARRPDPVTGQPDAEKVGAWVGEHPETVPAVTAAITAPIPLSYARLVYHSIHAYGFVETDGAIRHGRYHFLPDAGVASLSDDEALDQPADYLTSELGERLARGPVSFELEVELAAPADPVDDPTAVWPDERERVTIATIEITALADDRERDGDVLVFDPTRVPDGVALTDDKILRARPAAYAVSVARRTAVQRQ